MTVKELIDKLNTIEDKSIEVYIYQYDVGSVDAHDVESKTYNGQNYIEIY